MSRYTYFEDTEIEAEDIDDTDIAECSDIALLQEWWDGFEIVMEDISAQLTGHRLAGIDDRAWVYRACQKLAYLGRGQTRVRKRLRDLGVDPNPLGQLVERLNKKLQTQKAELTYLRAFADVAHGALSPAEMKAYREAALAKVEAEDRAGRPQEIEVAA